jgi:general secretion pathway protein K
MGIILAIKSSLRQAAGSFQNNRGMALLLTILIVSVIVVATLQFNIAMRTDLQAAANLRDGVKLEHNARSAVSLARAVLLEDGRENDYDTMQESWAKLPLLAEYSTSYLDEGRFELEVGDHSGRIQINGLVYGADEAARQLQREFFSRLLLSEEFGLDGEEVESILAAVIDWPASAGRKIPTISRWKNPMPLETAPSNRSRNCSISKGLAGNCFTATRIIRALCGF